MQSATFVGEVQSGRLRIDQGLADFEGKRVLITLTVVDSRHETGAALVLHADAEAELLEDVGRIRLPSRGVSTVTAQIVDVGRQQPQISVSDV